MHDIVYLGDWSAKAESHDIMTSAFLSKTGVQNDSSVTATVLYTSRMIFATSSNADCSNYSVYMQVSAMPRRLPANMFNLTSRLKARH